MSNSHSMHRQLYFTMNSWFNTNRRYTQFISQFKGNNNMVPNQDIRTNNKGGRVTQVIKVQPVTHLLDISQHNIIDQ